MGKGRNRTETIKKRTIYVYLPTEDMAGKWKEWANKEHLSISKFVIEHVNRSIQRSENEEEFGRSKFELFKELDETKKELDKAMENARFQETTIKRLEKEIERYRYEPFTFPQYQGVRHNPERLIEVFRFNAPKPINLQELLESLQITREETDIVNGVSKHVESLIRLGLIAETSGGWKWLG